MREGAGDAERQQTATARPKPNVDYSRWRSLDDSDGEDDEAAAIEAAERAATSAQLQADSTAAAVLAEVGGDAAALSQAARAQVQAKVVDLLKPKPEQDIR